jgi:hypothetical protein
MESLIFAAVIGLTIYLFMRRIKVMKEQKRRLAEQAASGEPPEDPGSMPRLGSPGTITRAQIKLLKENDFEPSRLWRRGEAYSRRRHLPAGRDLYGDGRVRSANRGSEQVDEAHPRQ